MTSRNVPDVRRLVQEVLVCLSLFNKVLGVKIWCKLSNTYLSRFRVETSGYNSPRTTQRFLEEDPSILSKKFSWDSGHQLLQAMTCAPIDGESIASIDGHITIFHEIHFFNSLSKTTVLQDSSSKAPSTDLRPVSRGLVRQVQVSLFYFNLLHLIN